MWGAAALLVGLSGCCAIAREQVVDEARAAIEAIPEALADDGPEAWIEVAAPGFRMASDGELKFADHAALEAAMEAFGPTVESMEMTFDGLEVEAFGCDAAAFSAAYDESLSFVNGDRGAFRGHVSGILSRTEEGWKVSWLHWSSPRPGE